MFNSFEQVRKWEMHGIVWIVVVGSLLHFTYELSGKSPVIGAFSPVNESLWEHLKLGYFPLLLYSIVEYWFLRGKVNSFFLPKAIGIISMELFIIIVFYSYTLITKKANFLIDISSFILGAIICQLISIRLMKVHINKVLETIGLILFLLIGYIFVYFTFNPPELEMFLDPKTKKYGI